MASTTNHPPAEVVTGETAAIDTISEHRDAISIEEASGITEETESYSLALEGPAEEPTPYVTDLRTVGTSSAEQKPMHENTDNRHSTPLQPTSSLVHLVKTLSIEDVPYQEGKTDAGNPPQPTSTVVPLETPETANIPMKEQEPDNKEPTESHHSAPSQFPGTLATILETSETADVPLSKQTSADTESTTSHQTIPLLPTSPLTPIPEVSGSERTSSPEPSWYNEPQVIGTKTFNHKNMRDRKIFRISIQHAGPEDLPGAAFAPGYEFSSMDFPFMQAATWPAQQVPSTGRWAKLMPSLSPLASAKYSKSGISLADDTFLFKFLKGRLPREAKSISGLRLKGKCQIVLRRFYISAKFDFGAVMVFEDKKENPGHYLARPITWCLDTEFMDELTHGLELREEQPVVIPYEELTRDSKVYTDEYLRNLVSWCQALGS